MPAGPVACGFGEHVASSSGTAARAAGRDQIPLPTIEVDYTQQAHLVVAAVILLSAGTVPDPRTPLQLPPQGGPHGGGRTQTARQAARRGRRSRGAQPPN